ncbi:MAG: peptidoglycan-binding protein [Pseudomonadota bacterium]
MSSGSSPWSVKGIDPRARAVAKSAARRDGMTLGEWLNRVILDDDGEAASDWTDQLEGFPGLTPDGKTAPAGRSGGRNALHSVVSRLGDRLEVAEQRSTLALTGVDQSLMALTRRLDALEETREENGDDLDAALNAARAAQDEALERIRKLERESGADGDPVAMKALETTIGKLASRLYETEQGVRGELDALGDRELRHARNAERALKAMDARVGDAVSQERKERNALRDVAEDRHRRSAEAIDGLNRAAQSLRQRLETAEAGTHQALGALVTSQERLAERLRHTEQLASDGVTAQSVEARFSAFADEIASVIRETRSDFANQISKAACAPHDIDRALAATEARLQASEQRHSDALARIGTEIERMARSMDARLSEAERKAETRQMADDTRRSRADLDSRLDAVRQENAQAVRRIGEQMARLGSSLADRVNQSEERSAAAVEAAGARMAGMLDKLETAREQSAGEDDLEARIRASEERTAERIETAMERIGETLQSARAQTEESLSPVQRAMTALAERLEAIETRSGQPDERADRSEAGAPRAFDLPVFHPDEDFSTPLPLAPGLQPHTGGDAPETPGFEVTADAQPGPAEPDFGGASFDNGFDEPIQSQWDEEPIAEAPGLNEPQPVDQVEREQAVPARPSAEPTRRRKKAAPLGATADADFIAAARATARNRSSGGAATRMVGFDRPARSDERGGSRLVLILASVLGFLAIGAAAAVLLLDLRAGPPVEADQPASLSSLFADADGSASTPAAGEAASPGADADPAETQAATENEPVQDTAAPAPETQAAPTEPGTSNPPAASTPAPPQTLPAAPAAARQPAPPPPAEPITLEQAAQSGDPVARYQLAIRRENAGDREGAAALMRRAAEQGVPDAQYRFAKMLERGEGVPENLPAALQWTLTAARGGHARAMHNAGVMYATGLGTTENYEQGARWFEQAALHGVRDSQFNLGLFYEQGLGVPQSLADAYAWFLIAGGAGDSAAAERADLVRRNVEPSARAQADRVADGFTARPLDRQTQGEYPPQVWQSGADSNELRRAQSLLAQLGYQPGSADGAWGPQTREAVVRYQSDRNLAADGVVNDALIARLERDAAR